MPQLDTNMVRRTTSGSSIHYISYAEMGHGKLLREDSFQYAGLAAQQRVQQFERAHEEPAQAPATAEAADGASSHGRCCH